MLLRLGTYFRLVFAVRLFGRPRMIFFSTPALAESHMKKVMDEEKKNAAMDGIPVEVEIVTSGSMNIPLGDDEESDDDEIYVICC